MLGTIIYAALDVSLNTTIWMIKTASNGIYYGVNYFLGYDTEDQPEDLNNILMVKLEEQNEFIKELKEELKEIKINLEISNKEKKLGICK